MRQVSEAFKEAIKQYGRQLDVMITYTENGTNRMLTDDDLFSVTPIVSANLMKSVMKQLNFESYTKVPKGTWINVRFGVLISECYTVQDVHQMKVDRLNNTEVRMLQGFEYINFGNYMVAEEPEYNADTLSYIHKCFDKMILTMKEYEPLNVSYPISIKNYLNALANKVGIRVKETSFYNQNQMIENELYADQGYTYRDILDEIAQATGSIIHINQYDKLEVKYQEDTQEIIDENSLKDIDVAFGKKYGKINSIVLSRSAESDNVYLRDEESVQENGLCEVKIKDNQIMNFNNRSDYLQGILNALENTEYYINDFKSTGICYLEVGDIYNVQIGNNSYKCLMLNDEIDITQGLEEQIHTEMPEQSETDYTKADKTDQRINRTDLIVDKQQHQIKATVSRVEANEQNISNLQIDVSGIHTEVSKKVGNNEIISKINQSAEAVTINANKIGLTANNILNIISGNALNLTSKNITIASTNFNVDKNGNMSCSNATVSGTITATGGTIGGFSVVGNADNNRRLMSNNKNVGMSSSTYNGDPSFWAGNTDPWEDNSWRENMPFYVTNQGYMKSTSGTIGGFSIYTNDLVASNEKVGISSSSYEGDPAFWAGSTTPWKDSEWYNHMPFYVTNQGYMKATNATISGTITATSGTFENCTIKSSCNIPAGAIKSGTMDASRISGGRLNVSSVTAVSVGADAIGVTTGGAYAVGDLTGENFQLVVDDGEKGWRRLTFNGGILVNVESSW